MGRSVSIGSLLGALVVLAGATACTVGPGSRAERPPAAAGSPSPQSAALADARRVLAAWLEAFNAGDAERMEALYAEDVVLHLSGGRPPLVGRRALREVDDFHALARPRTELYGVELHEEAGGRVRVSTTGFTESARTFDSLGIPRVTGLGAADALVIERGRIVSLRQADFTPACQELLGSSMGAAIAWLKARDDPRLVRMMPGGKVRLDGDTALLWIDATREWRLASGRQHDPAKLDACARPPSGR